MRKQCIILKNCTHRTCFQADNQLFFSPERKISPDVGVIKSCYHSQRLLSFHIRSVREYLSVPLFHIYIKITHYSIILILLIQIFSTEDTCFPSFFFLNMNIENKIFTSNITKNQQTCNNRCHSVISVTNFIKQFNCGNLCRRGN